MLNLENLAVRKYPPGQPGVDMITVDYFARSKQTAASVPTLLPVVYSEI